MTPSPFFTDEHTTLRLDTDYMQSVTVTSQNPQVVEYKWRPEAVWSDGAPVGCKDMYLLYLAAVSPVKDGDAQIFDSSPTGYDQIAKIDCSADQKTVTVTFATPFADYRGLWSAAGQGGSEMLPAHILEQRTGIADITKIDPRVDTPQLRAAGTFFTTGWNGFDPAVALSAGPFRIESSVRNAETVLVRNEKWWGNPAGPRQGHDHGRHRLAGERAEAAEQGGPGHRPAGGIGRLRADPRPGRGLHRVRRGRPDLRAHRLQHGPAAVRRPPRAAQGRGHLPEPAAAAGQPHPQRRPERGAAGQLHLPAQRGGLRGPLRAVRHGRRGRAKKLMDDAGWTLGRGRDLQQGRPAGRASRSATSSSTAAPRPSSRPSATANPPASRSSTPRPRTSTTGRCPRATSTPPCSPGSAGR